MDIKNYPKCKALLKEKVKLTLQGIQNGMLDGVEADVQLPPIEDALVEQFLQSILDNNISYLYNLFDEYNIILTIDYNDNKMEFLPVVSRLDYPTVGYSKRLDAEQAGFNECFEILEKLL